MTSSLSDSIQITKVSSYLTVQIGTKCYLLL